MRTLTLLVLLGLAGCEIKITPIPAPSPDASTTSSPSTSINSDYSTNTEDVESTSDDQTSAGVTLGDSTGFTSEVTSSEFTSTPTREETSNTSGEVPASSSDDAGTTSTIETTSEVVESSGTSEGTSSQQDPTSEVTSGVTSDVGSNDPWVLAPLPPPPSVPTGVSLAPECGISPQRCPQSGEIEGQACNLFGSDWWPNKTADQAGTHHSPAGSALAGLTAEHITPYGGWFTFVSPWTSLYTDEYALCWSEDETGLETLAALDIAIAENRCKRQRVLTREGIRVKPFIVTSLEPGTTYYFRAVYTPTWPNVHAADPASDVVSFTTLPDPVATLTANERPRLAVTSNQLASLQARYVASDPRVLYWLSLDESLLFRAYNPLDNVYLPHQFATASALRWRITGETTHRDGALYLLGLLLANYEDNNLTGNQYRWEGSDLAVVADLMWGELDSTYKQRILDAVLAEDENPDNVEPRFEDTDQQVAFGWIQLSHGLLFRNESDLDPGTLVRIEAVFDRAVRRWYGTFQPKMRRSGKIFGLAGGEMDDGVDYARGTQRYWLETMRFLDNNGMSQRDYSEWVWNHFRTHDVYGLLPDRSGVVSWGDVEGGDVIANGGARIDKENWANDAIHLCLLHEWCRDTEAGIVKSTLLDIWEPHPNWGPHHWALMCDDSSITSVDYTSLPTMYHSEGLGNVYDRTGWGENDSFLFFSAGWRAVDHNHDDVGHFSLWSNGQFVTHEIPEYEENSGSHNVLLMGEWDSQHFLWKAGSDSKIVKTSTSPNHLFVLADMTSAYNFDHSDPGTGRTIHEAVTRSLFWDKLTDRVVIYDRIVGGPPNVRTQNFLGSANIDRLFDEDENGRHELLSLVNGTGDLIVSPELIGVGSLVTFDRNSGEMP